MSEKHSIESTTTTVATARLQSEIDEELEKEDIEEKEKLEKLTEEINNCEF